MVNFENEKVSSVTKQEFLPNKNSSNLNFENLKLVWLCFRLTFELLMVGVHTIFCFIQFLFYCFYPPQPKSLKDEIILVTGGASGIGREICLQLGQHKNVTIVSWDLNEIENELLIKELKANGVDKAFCYQVDVSDRLQVESTAQKMRQEIGDVTILFNNAGISGQVGNAWELNPEKIQKVHEINVIAHSWTIRSFIPAMIQKGRGHIVQTCSILGFLYGRHGSAYCTSKAAVKSYTECLKEDLRKLPSKPNIKISLVYPHNTVTPMTTALNPGAGKYPFLMTYMSAQFVASKIIEGVLRNEEHIYIPGFLRFMSMTIQFLPPAVLRRFTDISDVHFDVK